MSVLSRELASYQSAVDQYTRDSAGFTNTLLKDANGNLLVQMNGVYYIVPQDGGNATALSGVYQGSTEQTTFKAPDGSFYTGDQLYRMGTTTSPGDANVQLVRQSPTSTSTTTTSIKAIESYDANGNYIGTSYYSLDANGQATGFYTPKNTTTLTPDPNDPTKFTATDYTYTYAAEPGAFTKARPDPTNAQLRKMNQGSLADQERMEGLETGIIRGGALKGGLRPPPKPAGAIDPLPDQPLAPIDYGNPIDYSPGDLGA